MTKEFDLQKARTALEEAKQALKDAERGYDRHCGVNAQPFISRIRVAEAKLQAARVRLHSVGIQGPE